MRVCTRACTCAYAPARICMRLYTRLVASGCAYLGTSASGDRFCLSFDKHKVSVHFYNMHIAIWNIKF